jgi:hypothetical protein
LSSRCPITQLVYQVAVETRPEPEKKVGHNIKIFETIEE